MSKTASAFIVYNKKILLLHRDTIPTINDPDKWGTIGGNVEEGESFDEAIRREIKEESNLSPRHIKYLGKLILPGHEVGAYLVQLDDDELADIKLGDEGQELKFFTFDELETTPLTKNLQFYLTKFRNQARLLIEGIDPSAAELGLVSVRKYPNNGQESPLVRAVVSPKS